MIPLPLRPLLPDPCIIIKPRFMAELTLKAIEDLLDTKLEPIDTKLSAIEETVTAHTATLASHTDTLDAVAKDIKVLLQAKVVTEYRLERMEHWAAQVGNKLGIKLEL